MPNKDKIKSVVFTSLIKNKVKGKSILVSVSGGLDSICLLNILNFYKDKFKLKLAVGYIHHGDTKNKSQLKFRNDSQRLVKRLADKFNLEFITVKSKKELKSENDFRTFRYEALNDICRRKGFDLIAVGHHKDDLLESRLIRLIRGVGTQGVEAMLELSGNIYRPLLTIPHAEIKKSVDFSKIKYLNDPSNKNNKFLRNWIRNKWLKDLELYRPGSLKSLAQSLENILPANTELNLPSLVTEEGISRSRLIELTKGEKRQVFAHYLRSKGIKNYTTTQIDEILKRLDSPKKELKFYTVGTDWTVDTRHIRCRTS